MVKDKGKDEPREELAALKKRVAELEQTLQNERETFGTIIQKSPYGVLLLGEKGKFIYINPEFVRVTGYALEDVPTGREWLRKAFPDAGYRKKVIDTWKADMAANVRGSAPRLPRRLPGRRNQGPRVPGGAHRRAARHGHAHRHHGPQAHRVRPHRERGALPDPLGQLPVGIALARPDGVFEYLNPRFTEIFGYTIEDLPDTETFLKRVFPNPSYRDLVRYFYREDLENFTKHRKVGERVVTIRVRGGSDRIMHSRMVVLGNGKQLMTYEDITDLKKMEAELFHAQNMEAVATLAGGIAHAFNNILMGIQGYTALMLSETKADHPA
jgi:PAS domain S-box-containing protein